MKSNCSKTLTLPLTSGSRILSTGTYDPIKISQQLSSLVIGDQYLLSLQGAPWSTLDRDGLITLQIGSQGFTLFTNPWPGPAWVPINVVFTADVVNPVMTLSVAASFPRSFFDNFAIQKVPQDYELSLYQTVTNGGFETQSIVPWYAQNGAAIVCSDGNAAHGLCYASMSANGAFLGTNVPVVPNRQYTVSFMAKVNAVSNGPVSMTFSTTSDSTVTTLYSTSSPDSAYQTYSVSFTASANEYTRSFAVKFNLSGSSTTGTVFVDDFSILDHGPS